MKEYNKQHHKITNRIFNPRRFTFKGRVITLKEEPRTGVCGLCRKQGQTNLHHFAEYHDDDPLRDTIELCVGCHIKQHIKNRERDRNGRFI